MGEKVRVWGSGFRVQGFGSGLGVYGLVCKVWTRVEKHSLGFRISGIGLAQGFRV